MLTGIAVRAATPRTFSHDVSLSTRSSSRSRRDGEHDGESHPHHGVLRRSVGPPRPEPHEVGESHVHRERGGDPARIRNDDTLRPCNQVSCVYSRGTPRRAPPATPRITSSARVALPATRGTISQANQTGGSDAAVHSAPPATGSEPTQPYRSKAAAH